MCEFPGFYGRWYLTLKPKQVCFREVRGFGGAQGPYYLIGRSAFGWDMVGLMEFWF